MDHIMSGIEEFLPIYLNDFLEDQRKHDHKTLKENPVYAELKLIVDSINLYRDFLSLPKLSLEAMVEEGLKGVRNEHFNPNATRVPGSVQESPGTDGHRSIRRAEGEGTCISRGSHSERCTGIS